MSFGTRHAPSKGPNPLPTSTMKLPPIHSTVHARVYRPQPILLKSMTRRILIVCIATLAACATSGAADSPPESGFPRRAQVDPRLKLSHSHRVQIARLIAAETSEPIRGVSRGQDRGKILVTTGTLNLMNPTGWAEGYAFVLQQTASGWKITYKRRLSVGPQTPNVSPTGTMTW